MAKSIISKGVIRKIRTADFEQLDIICEYKEETIEWNTEEERKKETKKVTKRLIEDFKETYNEIVNELGIDRCIGSVKTNIKKENNSKKNVDFDF